MITGLLIRNPLEAAIKKTKIIEKIINEILNPRTIINEGKRLITAFLELVCTKKKVFNINNKMKKDFSNFLVDFFSK